MECLKITTILLVLFLFACSPLALAEEATITNADTVWYVGLPPVSSDVVDATDTPPERLLNFTFVSGADTVWHTGLPAISSDVTDATDIPEDRLIKFAFVAGADTAWNQELSTAGYFGQPICCSNVVFLPGLLASRLELNGEGLWEPTWMDSMLRLFLNKWGVPKFAGVYATEIVDEAMKALGNVYKSFITFMDGLVTDGTINEWQAFPYDWRLDLRDLVDGDVLIEGGSYNMIEEVGNLAANSRTGKVTLIGHSNGGLLAKVLVDKLTELGKEDLVDKIILVASPQIGTPKTIMPLLHGEDTNFLKSFFLDQEESRVLSENMPSAYNLLPFDKYFDRVLSPVVEFDESVDEVADFRSHYGGEISSGREMREFLLGADGRQKPAPAEVFLPNVVNDYLLAEAQEFQAPLANWQAPFGIEVYQIVGWGLDTVSGIKYFAKEKIVCDGAIWNCKKKPFLDYEPIEVWDGDGTVVVPSAAAMEKTEYYLNFQENNKLIRTNRSHASILEVKSVRELINGIIESSDIVLPKYFTLEKPIPKIEDKRLRLSVHSPVSIDAYDSFGNHTGLINSSFEITTYEEQIPNSYYLEFGEGKYIGLDTEDEYQVVLSGLDWGTFTLKIKEVSGNGNEESVAYEDFPVGPDTKIEFQINTLEQMTEPQIDFDGDGKVDIQITDDNPEVLAGFLEETTKGFGLYYKVEKKLLGHIKKIKKTLKKDKKKGTRKTIKKLDDLAKYIKKNIGGVKEKGETGIDPPQAETLLQIIEKIKSLI